MIQFTFDCNFGDNFCLRGNFWKIKCEQKTQIKRIVGCLSRKMMHEACQRRDRVVTTREVLETKIRESFYRHNDDSQWIRNLLEHRLQIRSDEPISNEVSNVSAPRHFQWSNDDAACTRIWRWLNQQTLVISCSLPTACWRYRNALRLVLGCGKSVEIRRSISEIRETLSSVEVMSTSQLTQCQLS